MLKFLRNLYKKFLVFEESYFIKDAPFQFGARELKVSQKTLKDFYQNYYKVSFLKFLSNVKDIVYLKNPFDFLTKNAIEDWSFWYYLEFLEKEKIIKVGKNGKVDVLKKEILDFIPRPQNFEEIKKKLEDKLELKIDEKKPVTSLFEKIKKFKIKPDYDQMPISAGSAIFLVQKILERLPLQKKFLFIGDDDFISIILSLAEPKIESKVIDLDEDLLSFVDNLALKFNLKIETERVDIEKKKSLKEKFSGFLISPVYTLEGTQEFLKYGVNQLAEEGGWVFLNLGDESIGNRYLFLQDFFTKQNLICREIVPKNIYYPFAKIHYPEDEIISERLFKMIDKKIVKKNPKLGAALYVFEYVPFRIKKIKFQKSIYSYL